MVAQRNGERAAVLTKTAGLTDIFGVLLSNMQAVVRQSGTTVWKMSCRVLIDTDAVLVLQGLDDVAMATGLVETALRMTVVAMRCGF